MAAVSFMRKMRNKFFLDTFSDGVSCQTIIKSLAILILYGAKAGGNRFSQYIHIS